MQAELQRLEDIGMVLKDKKARLMELQKQEVTAEELLLDAERKRQAAQLETKHAQHETLLAIEAKNTAELAQNGC